MPRRGGLLYLYNGKKFPDVTFCILQAHVVDAVSTAVLVAGVKSLNTKIVRKIPAMHFCNSFVHQPFLRIKNRARVQQSRNCLRKIEESY